jgi:starch-binding outer membrane protein, SusD/RagB family
MNPDDYGINGGWFGVRTTKVFVQQFPDPENSPDSRAMFYTDGQNLEINSISLFNDGYAIEKFRNVDVNGNPGSDPNNHPDTDFPMFRLADIYLMYAEAHLRGGGGTLTTAVDYINQLRQRAYGNNSGNISQGDLTLNFIINERSRELYWEAHRRTDLIRFSQFSSQGIWPWKGNVPQGVTTEPFRDLMPLPATDLSVNPNLIQNPGY